MKKTLSGIIYVIIAASQFLSCRNTNIISHLKLNVSSQYCAPTIAYTYNPEFIPSYNTDSILVNSKTLSGKLSEHDILMANATGILSLVNQLIDSKKDTTLNGRINRLEISNKIQNHLHLLTTEISGIAAELDCEGERADLFAGYLDDLNDKKTARLTGASIVIAALATVAAVMVNNNGLQNGITIGGGVLSAGLAVLTIKPHGKKMSYTHERNVLEDIWFAPEKSTVYPPFIWYMLKEKRFSNNKQEPLVQTIKNRWNKFELNKDIDSTTVNILFKNGGIYDAENLHTRATMLNQLQSTIRSINQDMQSLMSELNNLNTDR
ncbi:hypothetical protein [Dyadobacter frigoris]|uniref:Uncharacterized protein n=1 Tax=Dyadobacter frigoris TaxID=2576211 RepID=A0A4U6CSB5_9BACT|nr:hypothetical protein [Dyadobacter frigoris]TKT87500.1 hypothetical protein FDK13_29740 [Dyadobacter frigoris]GLU52246.1 hypothetical protein Dfri01_17070 [Dyadobacter frigoris]